MKESTETLPDYKGALARIDLELCKVYHEHMNLDALDCGIIKGKQVVCFDANKEQLQIIKRTVKDYSLEIYLPSDRLQCKLWYGCTKKEFSVPNFIEYSVKPEYAMCLRNRLEGTCNKCKPNTYKESDILFHCNKNSITLLLQKFISHISIYK